MRMRRSAEVAELADAADSKSAARKGVGVRFPSSALVVARRSSVDEGPRSPSEPGGIGDSAGTPMGPTLHNRGGERYATDCPLVP